MDLATGCRDHLTQIGDTKDPKLKDQGLRSNINIILPVFSQPIEALVYHV